MARSYSRYDSCRSPAIKTNSMKTFLVLFCASLFFISCEKNYSDPYAGQSNNYSKGKPTSPKLTMAVSKWVLYQYRDKNMSTPQLRNDTLVFSNATDFKWNGIPCTYALSDNSISLHLSLYGTPFGDVDGMPPAKFQTFGEINDVAFPQFTTGGGQTYYFWMKKI